MAVDAVVVGVGDLVDDLGLEDDFGDRHFRMFRLHVVGHAGVEVGGEVAVFAAVLELVGVAFSDVTFQLFLAVGHEGTKVTD